jgi:hypothetical protein
MYFAEEDRSEILSAHISTVHSTTFSKKKFVLVSHKQKLAILKTGVGQIV